mmetsp:Transcript_57090/g.133102  ORF Transcript_57090/g.133102 Transcript_57090/m.133102 type:complete len:237 (-) Transcript_57090:1301-2011(-)
MGHNCTIKEKAASHKAAEDTSAPSDGVFRPAAKGREHLHKGCWHHFTTEGPLWRPTGAGASLVVTAINATAAASAVCFHRKSESAMNCRAHFPPYRREDGGGSGAQLSQAAGTTSSSTFCSALASDEERAWTTLWKAPSALRSISSGEASEMGCDTNSARSSSNPSMRAWYAAWALNSEEQMATAGMPQPSKCAASCMMHVVHEPQSASAATTWLHSRSICWRTSTWHGRVTVAFR